MSFSFSLTSRNLCIIIKCLAATRGTDTKQLHSLVEAKDLYSKLLIILLAFRVLKYCFPY